MVLNSDMRSERSFRERVYFRLRILNIFLLPLLISSCIPDPLEVENVPKVKPQIVVSTQIIPNQSLVVFLTKTVGALEASDDSDPQDLLDQLAVNDAVITLT